MGRSLDLVLASVLLVLSSPLLAAAAAAIKLESRGPAFYRQRRVGMGGVPFELWKLRTMVPGAEELGAGIYVLEGDPRITRVGRALRRLSLDELPNLLNVLRGEMSIVGPRPERPEFVQTLSEVIPFYRQRHSVKPGITGWAQINYKYGETMDDAIVKLEYDLYYIKNLSLSLDMYIIFNTLKAMLVEQSGQ